MLEILRLLNASCVNLKASCSSQTDISVLVLLCGLIRDNAALLLDVVDLPLFEGLSKLEWTGIAFSATLSECFDWLW